MGERRQVRGNVRERIDHVEVPQLFDLESAHAQIGEDASEDARVRLGE